MSRKSIFLILLFVFCAKGDKTEKYAHFFADSTVVAVVNDEPITQEKVDASARQLLIQSGAADMEVLQDSALQSKALDWVITHFLLSHEVKNHTIEVKDKEVDNALNMLKKNFPSEEDFERAIKEDNTSLRSLREDLVVNIKIQSLVQEQVNAENIEISTKEAEKYYKDNPDKFRKNEKIRARHILLMVDENASENTERETLKTMEDILRRVNAGEDFAQLARDYSQGPSAKNGGDLGFFARGDMDKSFEDAAYNLYIGQVSGVVRSKFGFHIIKMEDKKASEMKAFSSVEENIKSYLKQTKGEKAYQDYIDQLKDKASIVLRKDIKGEKNGS